MKSWWVGGGAGEWKEVLVAWMRSLWVGGGACGVDEELGSGRGADGLDEELLGGRRCWWRERIAGGWEKVMMVWTKSW